ncbi:MAG: helix-turn-helix domain-containing protein [Erysipelothrix sp.]|nr:helix-turn-helix domain-containing protein [Erysipelothrix sp.]
MNLSAKIKALRSMHGLSQGELANHLNVSRSTIENWEAGIPSPSIEEILVLSEFFNISTDQLLKDDQMFVDDTTKTSNENQSVSKGKIMFCTECGSKNAVENDFCVNCGYPFTRKMNTEHLFTESEYLQEIASRNTLLVQQQRLESERQALILQRRQAELQEAQLLIQAEQYKSMAKCPRCGSTSLSGNKKGYGIGKGVLGAVVAGPLGLMAGNIGARKVKITCMSCGHRFKK